MLRFLFRTKRRKRLTIAFGLLPVLLLGLWIAIHSIPGFGPFLADTARSILGPKPVAWVEDVAYGIEDWFNRKTRSEDQPEGLWEVPPSATVAAATPAPEADAGADQAATSVAPFSLEAVGPVHETVKAPGDGTWMGVVDPRHADDPPRLLKTVLHPDKNRSWTVVAVVAIDLRQVEIHAVAGRYEPESKTPEAKSYERRATIDPDHVERLIAAFNGGYKATHGYYGMKIDGVTLLPPRPKACTVARYEDGHLAIRSWEKIVDDEPKLSWWRQAPLCMFEEGKPHPALSMSKLGWGASSVSGTTVIRRSAIGLSGDGNVLYVGIGDFTTGETIARAMHHAGAADVAQLDVNFSYPKFVTYKPREPGSSELVAVALTERFEYTEDEYIRQRSHRDFFYLTRRDSSEQAMATP